MEALDMLRECSVNRGTLLGAISGLAHVYTSPLGLRVVYLGMNTMNTVVENMGLRCVYSQCGHHCGYN